MPGARLWGRGTSGGDLQAEAGPKPGEPPRRRLPHRRRHLAPVIWCLPNPSFPAPAPSVRAGVQQQFCPISSTGTDHDASDQIRRADEEVLRSTDGSPGHNGRCFHGLLWPLPCPSDSVRPLTVNHAYGTSRAPSSARPAGTFSVPSSLVQRVEDVPVSELIGQALAAYKPASPTPKRSAHPRSWRPTILCSSATQDRRSSSWAPSFALTAQLSVGR